MGARRSLGPEGAAGTSGTWDRAGALCALARSLFEPSPLPPDARAWAEVRTWPGVVEVPAPAGEVGVRGVSVAGGRVGVRVASEDPDLCAALEELGPLLDAAQRRWEHDGRRDRRVRSLVIAEREARLAAESARAEASVWAAFADELRSTVGHDVSNPLSVIFGHAQLLEAGIAGPATMRTTGATLARQVDRLARMFDRLASGLAIAGCTSPAVAADDTREPIADLVAAVLKELPAAAAERVEVRVGSGAAGSAMVDDALSAGGSRAQPDEPLGAPATALPTLLAVLQAALLAGEGGIDVEVEPALARVTVRWEVAPAGGADPRGPWANRRVDPSRILAAVARRARAEGAELDAGPGRVTLGWAEARLDVVGIVADPARAAALEALVEPPLRLQVHVAPLDRLPAPTQPFLVDDSPGARASWRAVTAGLLRPPPAVVLGDLADVVAFGVLPADASPEEVTVELHRAFADLDAGPADDEGDGVLIVLDDVPALVSALGVGGPERALRWVEGVAQWIAGSTARIRRVDATRLAVVGIRGDPATLAARIEACCADYRPRIGPFRINVPVRALAVRGGALRDA